MQGEREVGGLGGISLRDDCEGNGVASHGHRSRGGIDLLTGINAAGQWRNGTDRCGATGRSVDLESEGVVGGSDGVGVDSQSAPEGN